LVRRSRCEAVAVGSLEGLEDNEKGTLANGPVSLRLKLVCNFCKKIWKNRPHEKGVPTIAVGAEFDSSLLAEVFPLQELRNDPRSFGERE
jgi:hypothetical protein